MDRNCGACGAGFDARSPQAKFCSDVDCRRQRERARKSGMGAVVIPIVPLDPEVSCGPVESAALVELTAAGRESTSIGRLVLALAARSDALAGDTGSSAAALAKEYRAARAEALEGASGSTSVGDDLRARREARMSGA